MAWSRKSKYRAKRTEIDGITFHSRKEANRYVELLIRQAAGEIKNLEIQPKFPLRIGDQLICTYIADFRYKEGPFIVVEDVKGVKTPVYSIKKKLMRALYAIDIKET